MNSSKVQSSLQATPLFPVWLFSIDHPNHIDLNKELLEAIEEERNADSTGSQVSNVKGWQSTHKMNQKNELTGFVHFVEAVLKEIKSFLAVAENVELQVKSVWFNVNPPGARNAQHIHGNCSFSGVYYVEAGASAGEIEFQDPSGTAKQLLSFPYEERNLRNCTAIRYEPVEGRFFIFPSYLSHSVEENLSGKDRVSVSFNISAVES